MKGEARCQKTLLLAPLQKTKVASITTKSRVEEQQSIKLLTMHSYENATELPSSGSREYRLQSNPATQAKILSRVGINGAKPAEIRTS